MTTPTAAPVTATAAPVTATAVRYDPVNGEATPDGRAMEVARSLVGTAGRSTSSAVVVDALRVLRREGEIDDLVFLFHDGGEERALRVDERGKLKHWPKGFCDQQETFLRQLVKR